MGAETLNFLIETYQKLLYFSPSAYTRVNKLSQFLETFVTFDDVAAYFSEDDWQCLEEWQQELYQNAMQEIHGVLLAMGYTISNPDVLVRIKNVGTSNFSDNPDSSKSKKCCNFTHDFPSHHPDILLRVKQQTHTLSSDQLELQEQSCTTSTLGM
ncbi:hypothetical protein XELAEV_18037530mg [Xenopus laevis]|uniref:KRAB domain-containing protein n=1 Tax=Xenopus laevis TaxID=8355 RepID=A0A974HAP9_XENLA|nr:hypothetical protein XELAEV_18037530mg [Xenopus laevis]